MTEISRWEIAPLCTPVPSGLEAMTFPAYRHLLDLKEQPRHPDLGEKETVTPFGVVALIGGEPRALALAETPARQDSDGSATLLSVFVDPRDRRQGLATLLVGQVEREARRRGCECLSTVYTTGKPAIDWAERLLANRGWEEPVAGSLSVRFDPATALLQPQMDERRMRVLARDLEFFPWSELTASETTEIVRSNEECCWIEPSLSPFQFDPRRLDASSTGARLRGQVIGWILNHRVLPGLVRISVAYMKPGVRRARTLALYRSSLERLAEQGCRQCTFITPVSYPPMVQFIRRWMTPFADFVGESRSATLHLGDHLGDHVGEG